MKLTIVTGAVCAVLAAASASAQETAKAQLVGPDGQQVGEVTLIQGPHGVLITVGANGLETGGHGFHVHAVGQCEPDFEAAGDHYNPDGGGHGLLADGGYHAGDLPNLHVNADGSARADFFSTRISLQADAEGTLFDEDGSAIVIHERMDSYGDEAGAGGRVACGVVERAE